MYHGFPSTEQKDSMLDHNIHGYNCKIEYMEAKKNVCADMLSCLPHRTSDSNDDNEPSGPDVTDEMFEVSKINCSNITPKTFG